jgi:hypothetical protein
LLLSCGSGPEISDSKACGRGGSKNEVDVVNQLFAAVVDDIVEGH